MKKKVKIVPGVSFYDVTANLIYVADERGVWFLDLDGLINNNFTKSYTYGLGQHIDHTFSEYKILESV